MLFGLSEKTMSETTSCPAPSTCACAASCPTATKTATTGIQNGKGSAPRNISKRFRKNYDGIKWSFGGKARQEGSRFVKSY